MNGHQIGDPLKAVQVMLDVVRGEGVAVGRPFPTIVPLGGDTWNYLREDIDDIEKNMSEWEDVIKSTDFPKDQQFN